MERLQHELDNGLTILVEQNAEAHSQALGFFVQTGSRDESEVESGVSHFLEHMAFKGTPTRTADDVNREFDEMGAHYNAFTSEELTVYYAAVLPECQQACLSLLADIMRPSLRQDDFDTEKQVILEEIQMYEDQPPFSADDKCKALHFGSHALAGSVLGTADSITRLTSKQMNAYFQRRYNPNNMVLAGSGRVDFENLVRQTEQICGSWPSVPSERTITRPTPSGGYQTIKRPTATQQYLLQMMAAPAGEDDDRIAAKLLAAIVGDDTGSRVYWELVDSGLAESACLAHHEFQGAGVYVSYLCCAPDQASENLKRLEEIYRIVEQSGVQQAELDQAKTKIKSRIVLGSERPRNRLFSVGGNWASRREYRTVQDDLRDVDAISVTEVHAVLKKYPLSGATTLSIGSLDETQGPGRPPAAPAHRASDL